MNKNSILTGLLVLMIVLNVALLAFIMFNAPKRSSHNNKSKVRGSEFLQKEFGLNDEQLLKLDESREEHFKATKALNEQIQKSSIEYYKYTGDPIVKDSLLQVVTDQNRSFYVINDKHIDELRALCSADKKDEIERFIKAQINNRGNTGPPRLPRDGKKPQ